MSILSAKLEGTVLKLELQCQKPSPSATGKTLVVVSTHGNVKVPGVLVNGQPLTIGLNGYIKP